MPGETSQLLNTIISEAVTPVIGFLFALAAVVFIWGIIEFIIAADNEEVRSKGKRNIVWGIAGLFIMFSVWGLLTILQNFIGSLE